MTRPRHSTNILEDLEDFKNKKFVQVQNCTSQHTLEVRGRAQNYTAHPGGAQAQNYTQYVLHMIGGENVWSAGAQMGLVSPVQLILSSLQTVWAAS